VSALNGPMRQGLFYRPPGTGKTFVATQLAHHLATFAEHVESCSSTPRTPMRISSRACAPRDGRQRDPPLPDLHRPNAVSSAAVTDPVLTDITAIPDGLRLAAAVGRDVPSRYREAFGLAVLVLASLTMKRPRFDAASF
jgi:hypothetical protein